MTTIKREYQIGNWITILVMTTVSLICFVLLLTDSNQPSYYNLLCTLPLSFIVFSLAFYKIFSFIPTNIGVSLVVFLFFIRNVKSTLMMYVGNYTSTISKDIAQNTNDAILLVIYENLVVFFVLHLCVIKKQNQPINEKPIYKSLSKSRKNTYIKLVIIMLVILFLCIFYTPQLMMSYRTVAEINDPFFTNAEDSYVVQKYGTSFLSKLSLVVGNYIMRIALLIVPASIIVIMHEKDGFAGNACKLYSFLICFVPLFFIGGAIARSLIYVICLLLLREMLYNPTKINKKIVIVAGLGFVAILLFWTARDIGGSDKLQDLSLKFSSYFSGVNVVSGVFNLPKEINYKIKYFLFDFTATVPFGNTIFHTNGEMTIQPFFNMYNDSFGQIPPTIGIGYYYFGPIFAPAYSIIFALISFKAGEKIRCKDFDNPFQFARLIYTVFIFSMGIIMYNIEITMINTLCILVPIIIMEKIAYDK